MGKFDNFETIKWCGYEWIKRPLWGDNHPNEDMVWYDQDCATINSDNHIVLNIKRNPKTFNVPNRGEVTKEFGRGSVRTTEEFKYGTFEWEMKVPEGKYVWPALWLSSDFSWPPEIDCMEGWSGDNPLYIKRCLWRNIKPTMHWSENCDDVNGKHLEETKNNTWRWWLKCTDFDKYKVEWTPKYVDVYYNGHKVKRFNNTEMLEHMNKPEVKMHVIMSINAYSKFPKYYFDFWPMIVKSFKYTPYEK